MGPLPRLPSRGKWGHGERGDKRGCGGMEISEEQKQKQEGGGTSPGKSGAGRGGGYIWFSLDLMSWELWELSSSRDGLPGWGGCDAPQNSLQFPGGVWGPQSWPEEVGHQERAFPGSLGRTDASRTFLHSPTVAAAENGFHFADAETESQRGQRAWAKVA